ncbi:hypothetical protein KAFR_0A02370 [Kazachstania africana CBS 2517]|uniref:DNA mismatch repair protein n=1 Tax=Kazachstania africana (strain ATCC 22294 / BCRC 22015 / CBS 2517 / CECT 1963 / NBRC 1671 / NRRL Y-8276) TaxID=1071382 RepID=H2AMS5_KAZAF|nr:hypothetical protein KAFR_0A02370 [Kazachstania africana CBS 2517]CCF55675.1 hypothetical protein KAFR_0A02370 [Kazachstania africana CBS 2517]
MAPSTPKTSRILKAKDGNTSSQKKMKQSSLLSFFSKQGTTAATPTKKAVSKIKGEKASSQPIQSQSPSVLSNTTAVSDSKNTSDTSFVSNDKNPVPDINTLNARKNSIHGNTDSSIGDISTSTVGNTSKRNKRNVSYAEDSDDDDELLNDLSFRKSKRAKRLQDDEDDEDEYIPNKDEKNEADDDFINDDLDSDDDLMQFAATSERKPKLKTFTPPPAKKKYSPPKPQIKSKQNKFTKQNEERYQWLVNETDAQGRPPTDPEYDPRTLHIPSSAWNKFTPFERQYWEIKSKMWDCVVFFKKGKFFELYEKDALLGNSLFDLKLAGNGRANMQLAGIPEMSFEYWASQFIQHGYKVAKVDQRESMLAKEMREGSKGIVKRELECVLTSGTLTDGDMLHSDLATYCLAVREESGDFYNSFDDSTVNHPDKIFGISFIDTATGELQMLEFEDDNECSKLDTIMSQIRPKEIIIEKNNLSNLANKIVKFNSAANAIFNNVKPDTEFYNFDRTYDELISDNAKYFEDYSKWPKILKEYYEAKRRAGFSAFGGLLYYLKWLKLDGSLISMGNIKEYNPIKSQNSLILDGVTLQNLEIFGNSCDGTEKGTLFKLLNRAITPMGKRMMRTWLMHPLLQKNDIEKRLDSVDILMSDAELRDKLEVAFSKLPDLERMLARIHSSTIKVKDFVKVIQGFEDICDLLKTISKTELEGALKQYISQVPSSLYDDVENWTNVFDRYKASEEGIIIPHRGIEADFDKSLDDIKELENELDIILNEYRKKFKCSSINYKDSGKEIYTIEVPTMIVKSIPSNWIQMGANKSTKRYYSDEVKILARAMAEARESHKILEEDLKNRLCKKFDKGFNTSWMPTIHAIASVDCLIALTRTSECLGSPSCRPEFVDELDAKTGDKLNGFLKFKSLRHPFFNMGSTTVKEFIPNDIELGKDVAQFGLLTGANAAGKSTVLRMTCVAVIMAQMGCYLPCESAILTPVDRIMTRLGANDNIMQGKSTFYVELAETKKILDMATNRSLLVLDELGRGGSSSDGFAIAESVLHHVATHVQSLGFFATHYGTLGSSFKEHPQVRPLRMSIIVDEETRNVTFLYKLEDGESEGSFGMHVASMCGIPKSIVDNAQVAADNLEHTSRLVKERELATSGIDGEFNSIPLGLQSDIVRLVYGDGLTNGKKGCGEGVLVYDSNVRRNVLKNIFQIIEGLQ